MDTVLTNLTCKDCVKEALSQGISLQEHHRLAVGRTKTGILVYCSRHNNAVMNITPEDLLEEGLMLIHADMGVTMIGMDPKGDGTPVLIFSDQMPTKEDGTTMKEDTQGLIQTPTGIGVVMGSIEVIDNILSMVNTMKSMLIGSKNRAN